MTDDDSGSAPAVVAAVERGIGAPCRDCRVPLCGHEVTMSLVLGFKDAPRCLPCLARGLDRRVSEFARDLVAHVHRHDCWRAGWRRADELEGEPGDGRPLCALKGVALVKDPDPAQTGGGGAPTRFDAEWDAGDLGCGDLVLELRMRMKAMAGGAVLKLTARDPGAPQDLPAWCGLTGHALIHAAPPTYFIQRKKE
jgi:tRNA 2-thiouridine synthesizing protein A